MKRIGVVALQGGVIEHLDALDRVGVQPVPVKFPRDLDGIEGLVIPGGESTTIGKLMREYELEEKLKALMRNGLPVFGTCAGMILLAKSTRDLGQETLGAVDIEVRRNAFGRQVDSFEADLEVPVLGKEPFHGVFIRAPWIEKVGSGVEVLSRLEDGTPVAAREKTMLVTAFHPELTADLRFHDLFLKIVNGKSRAKTV